MQKNLQVLVWSSRCKFFWNGLDPTLVFFLTFFWKKLQRLDQVFLYVQMDRATIRHLNYVLTIFWKKYLLILSGLLSKMTQLISKYRWLGMRYIYISVNSAKKIARYYLDLVYKFNWIVQRLFFNCWQIRNLNFPIDCSGWQ